MSAHGSLAPPGPRRLLLLSQQQRRRRRQGGVCPGSAHGHQRAGAGKLDCGEKWNRSQEAPPGRVGTGGTGRAGRFVSGRWDPERAAAPPSAAPFPPLLPRAAARRVGRVTERESPGMCLWGLSGPREERGGGGGPRSAGAALPLRAGEGCFPRDALRQGEGFILPRRPWRWGAGWACVQRKGRRGGQSLPEPARICAQRPTFGGADLGYGYGGLTRALAVRAGGVLGFNKGCFSPPGGEGQLGKGGLQQAALSVGEVSFLFGSSFYYCYCHFVFKGLEADV